MNSFQGKVAVVTGAASGIGESTARLLHQRGATVFLADLDWEKVDRLTKDLGVKAIPVALDVRDAAQWKNCFDKIAEIAGTPDILVNAAGVLIKGTIEELDASQWNLTRAVNLDGVLIGSLFFLGLKRVRQGAIINLGSTSSLTGEAEWIAYCISKGAVLSATRAMKEMASAAGARTVAICPGGTDTPMVRHFIGQEHAEADEKAWLSLQPLRRFASPQEIAEVVLFAASDDCAWLNGSMLRVDGGKLA